MKNRFKFKVYFGDPDEKPTKRFNELYTNGYITFDGKEISLNGDILDLNEALRDESLIICQYTGINDSEGNEIYEGDIIQYNCCRGKQKANVFYKDGCFVVNHRNIIKPLSYILEKYKCIVIGNIFGEI